MNQENTHVSWQPLASAPVHQYTNPDQSTTFFQGGVVNFWSDGTLAVPSVTTTSIQTSETPPGTFQYYGEMESYKKHYCMAHFPVGVFQEGPGFLYEGCAKILCTDMSSPQTLQPLPSVPVNTIVYKRENMDDPQTSSTPTMTVREKTLERTLSLGDAGSTTDMAVTGDETETGSAGDLTACQVHKPSSSLPQGVAGPSAHSTMKPVTDAVQKRELRLMKNRLAAKQSRRKKMLYMDQLKSRNTVLEMENQALRAQLQSLKSPNI